MSDTGSQSRPARRHPRIVTRIVLALAGLVLLIVALGVLTIWGVQRAEHELRRVEHSFAQLENAQAIEAAFNAYLLYEIERRLGGGGDPSESPQAAMVRGALLTYRRTIGTEIALSGSEAERADERAEMIRASALSELFETIETRSVLDRIAGRHFDATTAARTFRTEAVEGRDAAFRSIIGEVVADEREEALAALADLERLRARIAIGWTALALTFLAGAIIFGIAFYRGLMRPIRALTRATEGVGGAAPVEPIRTPLPAEFSRFADRFNAMAERIGTETQRLNAEVTARTADLEEANARLRSIDESRRRFFANASHELRTPVTVLLGEAQVALRAGSGEREALERIAANGTLLTRRLDDLLRLARSEEGELSLALGPCDLSDAIRAAVESARAYASVNDVELGFSTDGPRPATGDPEALRQAALALIDNAVKLSPPGGRVEVHVGPEGFSVTDHGPGLEGSDPDTLFDRYAQNDAGRRAGGTGLGLAIVKWIAEKHGARMEAHDNPEGGATFAMVFPLEENA